MENVTSVSSMNDSFDEIFVEEDVIERYSSTAHAIVGLYLFILSVLSISANVSVIILFIGNKHLRNPMNLIFVNLAVSDLIISFTGTFFQSITTWARIYMVSEGTLCKCYGFAMFLGGEASLICLTVIAVERYLTVNKPFGIGNLTYRGSIIGIVFVWGFASIWAIGPLFGWSRYISEGLGTWCSIDWAQGSASTVSYIIFLFVFSYLCPIGLIVFSYGSVWLKVKEMAQADSATASTIKAEKNIAKMSCIMVSLFLFAWTPYSITASLGAFGPQGLISKSVAIYPSLFAKASCLYNAWIYIGMNKAFRKAFFMMVLGRDPFAKEGGDGTTGGETVGGNKVVPA